MSSPRKHYYAILEGIIWNVVSQSWVLRKGDHLRPQIYEFSLNETWLLFLNHLLNLSERLTLESNFIRLTYKNASLLLVVYFHRVSSPSWHPIPYIAKYYLWLVIPLPPVAKCWDYRLKPPYLVLLVLGSNPGLCMW